MPGWRDLRGIRRWGEYQIFLEERMSDEDARSVLEVNRGSDSVSYRIVPDLSGTISGSLLFSL
jgi:hypothetical protein